MRAALIAFACLIAAGAAQAAGDPPPPLTAAQAAAVDQQIHDYLLNHPDVLVQAISHAEDDAKEKENVATAQAAIAHREELERDPTSPVFGDPAGDVTVVEFFDYRCPYCKATAPIIDALLKAEPHIRLVLKDIPILGKDSVYASRVALVAQYHGKLRQYWDAVFALKDKATPDSVLKVASSIGLDPALVKKEMEAADIDSVLKRNLDLAKTLGVDGTPTFIIGTAVFPGAVSLDDLRHQIAVVRKGPA